MDELHQDVLFAGRAKAYRQRHAIVLRHAVMGQTRWQVEHVARIEHPFLVRLEILEDANRQVRQQCRGVVAGLAQLPAALAVGLDQEHVVIVIVRTDAATEGREAGHDVVDAPVGDEIEMFQQVGDLRHVMIQRLDQQGPVGLRQVFKGFFRERSVAQFPVDGAAFNDDAGFDFLFQRQPRQFVRLQQAFDVGKGVADQQRFFLPVVPQEGVRRAAAQDFKCLGAHGQIFFACCAALPV